MGVKEQLNKLREYWLNHVPLSVKDGLKIVSTLEKELKEHEMEHTLRIRLENINYELVREKQENEKKLKALEIISQLFDFKYFIEEWHKRGVLPQEEYNLLKEALL